ncbi:MAG: prephenate dehydratase [Gemmatimonadetes bacterium]|nr:prephenate dehydratase [Gemmatimonadota bacterium]MYG22676.1 prephenate dehydratase [Gemmatimonadota bacterium]MYJ39721.1 prephenate dehydratase [Gemmatimonadota bacterium]
MNLAYLGPLGTFSEQAALEAEGAALLPFGSIPAAVRAAEDGAVDAAVIPIENSLEGAVTQSTDILIHQTELRIRKEIVLRIHHCLLTQPGVRPRDVAVVYSHPQALAQCRTYVARNLPGAEPVASLSTAAAVTDMQNSDRPAAAISSARAAELFDAAVADRNIEDVRSNKTRFVMLAPQDAPRSGDDKTSICFDFSEDAAGILHGALGELAARDINMTKIESRPDRRSLGRYIFLIDVEGHREDAIVSAALEGIRARATMFKVLGSYPRTR